MAEREPSDGWKSGSRLIVGHADSETQARDTDRALSHHILPNSGTMIGVCVTLVGLVKVVEARIGPSHVDEYAAMTTLVFLTSAISSYMSIRGNQRPGYSRRLEAIADACFLVGLVSIAAIALFFAYEII